MLSTNRIVPAIALALAASFAVPSAFAGPGKAPSAASPEEKKEAQGHYENGAKYYQIRRYDMALKEFRASYDVVASPNSHLMIARTLREKGDVVDAYNEMSATADEAKALVSSDERYAETAEKSAKERDEIKGTLAFVTVRLTGQATALKVGGKAVPKDQWAKAIPVKAGAIEVVGTSQDGREVTVVVNAAGGASADANVDLAVKGAPVTPAATAAPAAPTATASDTEPPPGGKRGSLLPVAIGAGVVGVAGFAMFGVFGAQNQSTFDKLKKECPTSPCPAPSAQDDIDKGRTQQTLANVGLVVGIVGVAAAVTIVIVDRSRKPKATTGAAGGTWVAVGPGDFHAGGTF